MTSRTSRIARVVLATALVAPFVLSDTRGAEIEKKWRVGFSVGGYDTQDSEPSAAANTLLLEDPEGRVFGINDPRNDRALLGELEIKPAPRVTASVEYGINRFFFIEGSVGYQEGDLGDVELQVQFFKQPIDPRLDYEFVIFPIDAGTVTQVPLQLSAIARFRPKANFNPYIGAGVGYTFIGYDSSAELDTLSTRLDGAKGAIAGLGSLQGFGGFIEPAAEAYRPLSGATVDARDTFTWHVAGGAEFGFKKRWAAFVDVRYVFASRTLDVKFNDQYELGVSVPETLIQIESFETYQSPFGPMQITDGGLVDGGRLVPADDAPFGTDCAVDPAACVFSVGDLDGQVDPGFYYIRGGSIKYGGPSAQVGIKFTF